MEQGLTQKRQQAHALLDMLPDEKVAVVSSLLRSPARTVVAFAGLGSG
jgi:hypothetical protein